MVQTACVRSWPSSSFSSKVKINIIFRRVPCLAFRTLSYSLGLVYHCLPFKFRLADKSRGNSNYYMRTVMYSFVVATASQWRKTLRSFKDKFLRQTDKRANYGKGFHPNKTTSQRPERWISQLIHVTTAQLKTLFNSHWLDIFFIHNRKQSMTLLLSLAHEHSDSVAFFAKLKSNKLLLLRKLILKKNRGVSLREITSPFAQAKCEFKSMYNTATGNETVSAPFVQYWKWCTYTTYSYNYKTAVQFLCRYRFSGRKAFA